MIKTPQRLIFFGTPDFGAIHLKALWDTHKTMVPSIECLGVFTQPDRPVGRDQSLNASPVKRVALASQLPLFQPLTLRHADLERQFHDWEPDLAIVVAYGLIIPPSLLTIPRLGFLNVHASLLPRHRGASPIQAALLAGDQETGITLMRMDEHVDTGPIYTQIAVPIAPRETATSLHDRLAQCGAKALCEALPAILEGRLRSKPQHSEASTCPKIQKDFGKLHWSESASVNDRKICALNPWPGTFTTWTSKKKTIKILAANPVPLEEGIKSKPGTLIQDHTGRVIVVCGEGGLQIQEIQMEGKKPMPVADFLRGTPDFVGTSLN